MAESDLRVWLDLHRAQAGQLRFSEGSDLVAQKGDVVRGMLPDGCLSALDRLPADTEPLWTPVVEAARVAADGDVPALPDGVDDLRSSPLDEFAVFGRLRLGRF